MNFFGILQRDFMLLNKFNQIIHNQYAAEVVEKITEKWIWWTRILFTIQAVFYGKAEIKNLRIVHNASTRGNRQSLSLNDCLEMHFKIYCGVYWKNKIEINNSVWKPTESVSLGKNQIGRLWFSVISLGQIRRFKPCWSSSVYKVFVCIGITLLLFRRTL